MVIKQIGEVLAEAKARGQRIALFLTALDLELQEVTSGAFLPVRSKRPERRLSGIGFAASYDVDEAHC